MASEEERKRAWQNVHGAGGRAGSGPEDWGDGKLQVKSNEIFSVTRAGAPRAHKYLVQVPNFGRDTG